MKRDLTTSFIIATQRAGIHPDIPPGRLRNRPEGTGTDSLSVALSGNPEWSWVKVVSRPITLD